VSTINPYSFIIVIDEDENLDGDMHMVGVRVECIDHGCRWSLDVPDSSSLGFVLEQAIVHQSDHCVIPALEVAS
jgi:hypothetical protein